MRSAHQTHRDSAIVAVAWPLVSERPETAELVARADRPSTPADPNPLFWEYYHPYTGEPLGARLMTWSAAILLDLLDRRMA